MFKKGIILLAFALITLGVWYSFAFNEPTDEYTTDVLFIGNSYTYRNKGLDQHLNELASNSKEKVELNFTRAAQGKFHLHTHYKNDETQSVFKEKKWDHVVLQEYSSGSIKERKSFFRYGMQWARKIRKRNPNAKIYLYATWGYKWSKSMTDSVYHSYSELGKKIDATVVPVGKLWSDVQQKVNLYDGDGAHPNRKGTFLTSCLFYEVMTQKNVLKTRDTDVRLPKYLQRKLKKYAHRFYQRFKAGKI